MANGEYIYKNTPSQGGASIVFVLFHGLKSHQEGGDWIYNCDIDIVQSPGPGGRNNEIPLIVPKDVAQFEVEGVVGPFAAMRVIFEDPDDKDTKGHPKKKLAFRLLDTSLFLR